MESSSPLPAPDVSILGVAGGIGGRWQTPDILRGTGFERG